MLNTKNLSNPTFRSRKNSRDWLSCTSCTGLLTLLNSILKLNEQAQIYNYVSQTSTSSNRWMSCWDVHKFNCVVRREAVQVIISRFYTVTRWRRAIDWRCLKRMCYLLFWWVLGHVTLKSFVSHRLNDPTLLQLKISSEEKRYSNNFLFKSIKVYQGE